MDEIIDKDYRISQFMPFDSLKGFREALKEQEEVLVEEKELPPFMEEEISNTLSNLKKMDMVNLIYYNGGKYIEISGVLTRINLELRYLQIIKEKINFDQIYRISVLKNSDF